MLIFGKHFTWVPVMMKQKEVFNKIGGIIKELNDQYQYLQASPEELNDLELELFVANTHFLADHAEVLRKINKQNIPAKPAEEKPSPYEKSYFEPVIRKADPEPEPEPEIIKHELEIDESWADDEDIAEDINIEDEELINFGLCEKRANPHYLYNNEEWKSFNSQNSVITDLGRMLINNGLQ